jgi:hypothetical protein
MYLGRPTSIKISDLSISSLMNHQSQGSGRDQRDLETQICGPLLNLMGLTSKITGYVYPMQSPADYSAYVTMAGLDDELKAWYDTLAASLSWDPSKAQAAPPLFFHLQYVTHLYTSAFVKIQCSIYFVVAI